MENIDLSGLSPQELQELATQAKKQRADKLLKEKEAYEGIKNELLTSMKARLDDLVAANEEFKGFIRNETKAFHGVMWDYGKLYKKRQENYSIESNTFKIDVTYSKKKGFDERANVAANRLMVFLSDWMSTAEGGDQNPMYNLSLSLLQKTKKGKLNKNNIKVLYAQEQKFNNKEYSEIMDLFKESNTIVTNQYYYSFFEINEHGRWVKIEPSFNRI
ncbi:MAG: DUF3164 family protein [Rikenellaceae bacterium]